MMFGSYHQRINAMSIRGQSIIEYVVLIGVVTMALLYMGTDFKRGVQGVLKVTADQLGRQDQSDQDFGYQTTSGVLVNSFTNTQQNQQKTVQYLGTAGIRYTVDGATQSMSNSLSNQTFSVVLPSNS